VAAGRDGRGTASGEEVNETRREAKGGMIVAKKKSTSEKPKPPELQLGWLLEALPALVPVNLRGEGLTAHTAIIAQSGSGKSFLLGRLLEEVAAKTKARIIILDPNSDFAQFSTVEESAWTSPKGRFAEEDTSEAFKQRWGKEGSGS
jgi:DNA helicase HerA-like ATPase